jgi:hypothetical protein
MANPFEFKYPDNIQPNDVIDLFVPVFGEYYNVPLSGHTFINGARGSGKSMMFRYMKPDCQVLVGADGSKLDKPRKITDLNYFGIYIPIKKGHLNKTDIQLNNKHGEALLNEHYMVSQFALNIFKELSEIGFENNAENIYSFTSFFNDIFCKQLYYAGYKGEKLKNPKSLEEIFLKILNVLKEISSDFQHGYLKKLIGATQALPYNGPLFLYADFMYELLNEFRMLPFMPQKPIYLLIDDADELNVTQRKILNSWVSLRTSDEISLKISTQLKYKIFSTINDSRIDTPHDYSEVNLNDIYTTKKDLYYKRLLEIVSKRLQKYNFEIKKPEDFFPADKEQQTKIENKKSEYFNQKIKEGLTKEQAYDYAYRYAIPDFIKELGGNRYTYSYAGFDQLVSISSGIIREFIDFSSEMYVAQLSENNGKEVVFIDPSVQNREINRYSDKKIDGEFDKVRDEADNKGEMDKLRNLLLGIGGLFRLILHSDASERRVFSVALNDEPDEELKRILDLAVQLGYLQRSMIGNKFGTGKSRLYILNRTLAPHFRLDTSSFAGYKFMNSDDLKKSLYDHRKFIDVFRKNIKGSTNENQGTLFTSTEE